MFETRKRISRRYAKVCILTNCLAVHKFFQSVFPDRSLTCW